MAENATVERIAAGNGVVLQVNVHTADSHVEVSVQKEAGPACVLHWGAVHVGGTSWPPQTAWPAGSTASAQAVDTPLGDGLVALRLQTAWRFGFLDFVLFDPKTSRWDSNQGRNYRIVLPSQPLKQSPATLATAATGNLGGEPRLARIADEIVDHETSPGSWTLMHRFNLAWDLLDRVRECSFRP